MKKNQLTIAFILIMNADTAQVAVRTSDGNHFLNYFGCKAWINGNFHGCKGNFFADVNCDKKADAIAVNDNNITVRLSNGGRFFDFLGSHPWTRDIYAGTKVTLDVNGDGEANAICRFRTKNFYLLLASVPNHSCNSCCIHPFILQ